MALHDYDDLPIPPELIGDPDDDWVEGLIAHAEQLAADTGFDPGTIGREMADGIWQDQMPPKARTWRITDDGSAEWAMAHFTQAEDELASLRAQADVWAEKIAAWFEHRAKPLHAKQAFFGGHLMAHALRRREDDPKAKTLVLPSGAVKTTEHKPRAVVENEQAVIAWADLTLPPDEAIDVAPYQPRKVYVNPLRDHVKVIEVIDQARIVLANSGEVIEWASGPVVPVCPQPGDGWPSPVDATDLVARVEVLRSHPEVQGPDGQPVPGVQVDPGGVTAKVVPA